MNWPVPASAPEIDTQGTREQHFPQDTYAKGEMVAPVGRLVHGSQPLQGRRLATLLRTSWHRVPDPVAPPSTLGNSSCTAGPFLSSGVHRSWQRTKNILVVGKCLLSTFDAPDMARNGGRDSEDRRHSGLNAAPESPGPGVLTGFLEARPPLQRLETLSWCDHSFSELSPDGVLEHPSPQGMLIKCRFPDSRHLGLGPDCLFPKGSQGTRMLSAVARTRSIPDTHFNLPNNPVRCV